MIDTVVKGILGEDPKDNKGNTPLHVALKKKANNALYGMLTVGAEKINPFEKDGKGQMAFDLAKLSNNEMDYLSKKSNLLNREDASHEIIFCTLGRIDWT